MAETLMNPFELAAQAANLAEDKKAKDTRILQTELVSSLADFFVITSVDSRAQMNALTDTLVSAFKEFNLSPIGLERDASGHWSVVDFGDVIIHIMNANDRQYYQLERFWNQATELPRANWEQRQAS